MSDDQKIEFIDVRMRAARMEIETLRRERDEARQCVCCQALPSNYKEWKSSDVDYALKLIAAQHGWDCFKEAK